MLISEENIEIIRRYHEYVIKVSDECPVNLPLFTPIKFDFRNDMCCQWLVLAVLSIQDEVRKETEQKVNPMEDVYMLVDSDNNLWENSIAKSKEELSTLVKGRYSYDKLRVLTGLGWKVKKGNVIFTEIEEEGNE